MSGLDNKSAPVQITDYVRSVRDAPPLDYVMKIEPFSMISKTFDKSDAKRYESGEFEAVGHKWRLILYPQGNTKSDGNGYISLYLAMLDAEKLAHGSDVSVMLKFYVLDQIRANYITFEDGSRLASFHAFNNERGVSRYLSLSEFSKPSNGFLAEDCCAFGVEVTAMKTTGKGERLVILREPEFPTFTWKIDNFSKIKDIKLVSEKFVNGGLTWNLQIYPNGLKEAKEKSLGLYLTSNYGASDLRPGWKHYVACTLIVKDQMHNNDRELKYSHWFSASSSYWGFQHFLTKDALYDTRSGYILKDTVIVQIKMHCISVVSSFA